MNDTIEAESTALIARDPGVEPQEPLPLALRPSTAVQNRIGEVSEALMPAYQKASTLELTDSEVAALTADFPDCDVEIRPHDGLIYIPHIAISDRLCDVFRPGKWCMVRRREWLEGNRIYAEWVLLIRGCLIGESVGAMDYHPNNPKMNYSDALEGTRGECIRRIAGKELKCGSQVWRPGYCRQWMAKNAAQVHGKWQRRLTDYTAPAEPTTSRPVQPVKTAPKAKQEAKPAVPDAAKLRARFMEVIEPHRAKFVDMAIKAGWLLETDGLSDLNDKYIPKDKAAFEKLMEELKK